jgi:hypothetical protein
MITPQIVNYKVPFFLPERIVSVGAMREETRWLYRLYIILSEPCFHETENVAISDISLEGNPCLNFVYLVVKRLDIGIILGRGE